MNLHLSHAQTWVVHREAGLASKACERPLSEVTQDPEQGYIQSRQQILDAFLESVETHCGYDVVEEILAWAESDFTVTLGSGKTEGEWFSALAEIRNNYEKISGEIEIEPEKLKKIAEIIEINLLEPRFSLKEECENLCALSGGVQLEIEMCETRFRTIRLVVDNINIRRCWENIVPVLEPKEQDVIFRWYLETRKRQIEYFPEFKKKISPLRISKFRSSLS